MRRRWLWLAIGSLASLASAKKNYFKGYVNPTRYFNLTTGRVFLYDTPDREPEMQVLEILNRYVEHHEEYAEIVRRHIMHSHGKSPCDSTLSTQDIWPHIQRLLDADVELSRSYVNVGAGDGHRDDPLYEYASRLNATGVALEISERNCKLHAEHLPNVHVVCSEVTPHNVVELVTSAGILSTGDSVDVIKVDIDSFDCPVAEELLRAFNAKIVVLEANPSIPPPFKWAMLYHPGIGPFFRKYDFLLQEVPIRGCSVAYEVELLHRFGYDLFGFGGHDALFVRSEHSHAFAPLEPPVSEFKCYHEAYIAANGIPISSTRRWFYELEDLHQGLEEIWDFFIDWMAAYAPTMFPFSLRV